MHLLPIISELRMLKAFATILLGNLVQRNMTFTSLERYKLVLMQHGYFLVLSVITDNETY